MRVRVGKSEASIETVRIPRCEQSHSKAIDRGVTHRSSDHKLTKTESAMAFVDEDVTEPREGCLISHPPSKAHLCTIRAVAADHDGEPKRSLNLIKRPIERPVTLLAQPAMYLRHVEAILVITDDVPVVANSFHDRPQ